MSKFANVIPYALSFVILVSCAQKRIPPGGPVDKTPPYIIEIKPDSINKNIKKLPPVFLKFSEMIDEGSIFKALRIMPPKYRYIAEWLDFDELKLIPQQPDSQLRETVIITIGRELADLRKNSVALPIDIVFTPNDSLPNGEIKGHVYGISDPLSLQAWVFNKDDSIFSQPFRFTNITADGSFFVKYINDSSKSIPIVIEDAGKKYELGLEDRIFLPYYDKKENRFIFWKSISSSSKLLPEIEKILSAKKNLISWKMDSRLASIKFLFYSDSLQLYPKFLYQDPQKANIYYAWFDSLSYNEIQLKWCADSLQNSNQQFIELEDVLEEEKFSFTMGKLEQPISPDDTLLFFSNVPFDSTQLTQIETSDNVSPSFAYNSPVKFSAFSKGGWPLGVGFSINFRYLPLDTVLSFQINTLQQRDLGKISGKILNYEGELSGLIYIVATDIDRSHSYGVVSAGDSFSFEGIRDGYYTLKAWIDINGNGKYDLGQINPLLLPEPFWFSPDTLKVRKRWENHSSIIIF